MSELADIKEQTKAVLDSLMQMDCGHLYAEKMGCLAALMAELSHSEAFALVLVGKVGGGTQGKIALGGDMPPVDTLNRLLEAVQTLGREMGMKIAMDFQKIAQAPGSVTVQ